MIKDFKTFFKDIQQANKEKQFMPGEYPLDEDMIKWVWNYFNENKSILNPPSWTLVKLGSIIVHYQEFLSDSGHSVDKNTAEILLKNEDVREWFKKMNELGMLPLKR